MTSMITVLKIGGNQLDDAAFVAGMAAAVAQMPALPVVVHGGGQGIKKMQEQLGLPATFINGLRVTDAATLEVVKMVLIGQINPMLVAALGAAGVAAEGFNGADRALLLGQKLAPTSAGDLGFVGQIQQVRASVLHERLAVGVVPVIAPLALDAAGQFYNINADQAAGAVAAALASGNTSARVVFLTNVPGVLHNGQMLPQLSRQQAEAAIADGTIADGMRVKVLAAFDALEAGVGQAVITNLAGLQQGTGTTITANEIS
jgi:acetylglutamate kinase